MALPCCGPPHGRVFDLMKSILTRYLLLTAFAAGFLHGQVEGKSEKTVPVISEPVMERIQLLALTMKLQDYPITQTIFQAEIKGNPYLDLGGGGGSGIQDHEILALTDPGSEVGYYALRIFFGDHEAGTKNIPLISGAEIIFRPKYSERFFVGQSDFVHTWGRHSEILEHYRRWLHLLEMKPAEFVRLLDEQGMPSEALDEKINAAKKKNASPTSPK